MQVSKDAGELSLAQNEPDVPDDMIPDGQVVDDDETSGETPGSADTTGDAAPPKTDEKPSGPDETGEPGQEGYKPKGGFQKRIHQLTREKLEAIERIADLEQKLKAGTGSSDAANAEAQPKPEDYTDKTWDDYYADLAEWKVKELLRTERNAAKQAELTEAQERARTAATAEETELRLRFQARVSELRIQDDICFKQPKYGGPIVTDEMAGELLRLDHGADVLRYLGQNKAEAEDIAQKGTRDMQRALWRLEDKVTSAPQLPPTTKAPPPITPVSTAGGSPRFDPEKGTYADYIAEARKRGRLK